MQQPIRQPSSAHRVSIVIPCLNEEENIDECVRRARGVLADSGLAGEVIVVDNGSEDRSAELAAAAGATVVHEPRRGYGSAYLAGFAAARGDYIVMIDADLTYDFEEIPNFVRQLDEGAELVMGNRMKNIEPGAMSLTSRIGNPILSGFLNLVYRTPIGDAHCGLRAVRRDALPRLDLQSTGMEFASEMVIRAVRAGPRHPRAADRVAPARRRVEALAPPRRLAAPPPHARLQPRLPLPHPGRGDGRRRAAHDRHGAGEADDLRPAVLHPRGDRRLDARHRRHRGDRSRPDRTHLRLLLHGRRAIRSSSGCTATSRSSTA